jgi:hypothetical protein
MNVLLSIVLPTFAPTGAGWPGCRPARAGEPRNVKM